MLSANGRYNFAGCSKQNVEEVDMRVDNYVDTEWMAYNIGGFRYLQSLNFADCQKAY